LHVSSGGDIVSIYWNNVVTETTQQERTERERGPDPMATVSRPRNITAFADAHGLERYEVTTLMDEHGVPSYFVGTSRLVDPEHQPRLEKLLRKLARRKAAKAGAASSGIVDK
jgi:hypothetical protein